MAAIIGSETTPTIGAAFISEHWAKEAQLADRKEQVLAATVDTQYESEMRSGRTLHIAHVLNQAATAKSDNTVVVPDANTPTNQDITVSRYFYSATNWQFQTQVQADVVDIDAHRLVQPFRGRRKLRLRRTGNNGHVSTLRLETPSAWRCSRRPCKSCA